MRRDRKLSRKRQPAGPAIAAKSMEPAQWRVKSKIDPTEENKCDLSDNAKQSLDDSKIVDKPQLDRSQQRQYPAVSNVHFKPEVRGTGICRPVKYFIPHSSYYDDGSVAELNKIHPCTLKDLHRYDRYNRHPLCAAIRSISEAHAITVLQRELYTRRKIVEGKILDVGGSVNRHISVGSREFIHCCKPNFDQKDLIRNFSLMGCEGEEYCKQPWSLCECHSFLASMSVHSLYYVEPKQMINNMLRQHVKIHVAVIHLYDHESGSLMNGEMEYRKLPGGLVSVEVKGNYFPYQHSDMNWLNAGFFEHNGYVMSWELERSFLDAHVFKFVVEKKTEFIRDFIPVTQKEVDYSKLFNYCYRLDNGKPAEETEFVRRCIRENNKDNKYDSVELSKQARLWFIEQRSKDKTEIIGKHGFWYHWGMKQNRQLSNGEYSSWYPFLVNLYAQRYKVLYSCIAPFIALYRMYRLGNKPTIWDFGLIYSSIVMWGNIFDRVKGSITRFKLFDYCFGDNGKVEVDSNKTISYQRKVNIEPCEARTRAYPFMFHRLAIPFLPRNCDHNYVACIENKVLVPTPVNNDFSDCIPQYLIDISHRIRHDLIPLTFSQWVERFPSKKRYRLIDEYDLGQNLGKVNNDSKLFIKSEFYPEAKSPRPIHSSSVELNYSVGRWLVPLAELLAENLSEHTEVLFPLHADSLDIGLFAARYRHYHICMCDFSRFDSTQHSAALKMINQYFSLCGVPPQVVELMNMDTRKVKVRSRSGHKYTCKGLRLSGRSETLLGNSLLTLILFSRQFGSDIKAILVKGDDIVLFLKSLARVPQACRTITEEGFILKFDVVQFENLEFCSSYFVPCEQGWVLTPKPGKLLAKTFWCKNTNFNEVQMKQQFVGMLKGLKNNFGYLPWFNALYSNKIYLDYFEKVDAIQGEYNEYTDTIITPNDDTKRWIKAFYDLDEEELNCLSDELLQDIPIELKSEASTVVIEKDWGLNSEDASDRFKETVKDENQNKPVSLAYIFFRDVILAPIWEEIVRSTSPWFWGICFGVFETFSSGNWRHMSLHLMLTGYSTVFGMRTAMIVHFINNLLAFYILDYLKVKPHNEAKKKPSLSLILAGTWLYKNYIMKNKSKLQLQNEIKSLKGMVKSNTKRRGRNRGRKSNSSLKVHAQMLADPCNADLYPGLLSTDEGILAKLKSVSQFLQTESYGYILWCPHYASSVSGNPMIGTANIVGFITSNAQAGPTNTSTSPAFTNISNDCGFSWNRGATNFVSSSTVSDFRLVSACMKAMYVGTMVDAKGQIAYLENISADTVLYGNNGSPATVNQLFNLSTKVTRLGVDDHEIKFRPNQSISGTFKTDQEGIFTLGDLGDATSLTDEAKTFSPTMFGFAFKGVNMSQIVVEQYHNIEWRPDAVSGYTSTVPRQIKPPGYLSTVMKYLDDTVPDWTTRAVQGGANIALQLSKMALTGATQGLISNSKSLLKLTL